MATQQLNCLHADAVALSRPNYPRCLLYRFRARDKLLHLLQILCVTSVVLIGFGFRIDAGWLHHSDGFGNVVGSQSTGDDDGDTHALYDLSIDFPAVGYPECTYLYVPWSVAVQKQQVSNSIIASRYSNASIANNRNAAHQGKSTKSFLELSHGC